MEPLPPRRILPPDTDRTFMELDPDSTDTLVVSWHKDVIGDLSAYQYEAAALLWLALTHAAETRRDEQTIRNLVIAMFLAPFNFLTNDEVRESIDRLAARGFIERVDAGRVSIDPLAIAVVERRQLSAQFRMDWNAAKAIFGTEMPQNPDHNERGPEQRQSPSRAGR